jgi:pimeloyl-ACP methyl ester carboxylesterase
LDAFADAIREGARAGITPLRPLAIAESRVAPDIAVMEVVTADGIIVCLRHGLDAGEDATALFVGGALGGLSGPAHGLYHTVARRLGGVRIHYRKPGHLEDCLFDVLLVQHLLSRRGVERVALVGHSFGGAVAVGAGVLLASVTAGVVALSTQVPGTEAVDRLTAPLLLVHGDNDGVLPDLCSRNVHERATSARSRELVVLPGEGHLLDGAAASDLADRVTAFLQSALVEASA